jgi:hypothetical protein
LRKEIELLDLMTAHLMRRHGLNGAPMTLKRSLIEKAKCRFLLIDSALYKYSPYHGIEICVFKANAPPGPRLKPAVLRRYHLLQQRILLPIFFDKDKIAKKTWLGLEHSLRCPHLWLPSPLRPGKAVDIGAVLGNEYEIPQIGLDQARL